MPLAAVATTRSYSFPRSPSGCTTSAVHVAVGVMGCALRYCSKISPDSGCSAFHSPGFGLPARTCSGASFGITARRGASSASVRPSGPRAPASALLAATAADDGAAGGTTTAVVADGATDGQSEDQRAKPGSERHDSTGGGRFRAVVTFWHGLSIERCCPLAPGAERRLRQLEERSRRLRSERRPVDRPRRRHHQPGPHPRRRYRRRLPPVMAATPAARPRPRSCT